eukprot:4488294-Pleurochrysis_carterae.AAC.1
MSTDRLTHQPTSLPADQLAYLPTYLPTHPPAYPPRSLLARTPSTPVCAATYRILCGEGPTVETQRCFFDRAKPKGSCITSSALLTESRLSSGSVHGSRMRERER